MTLVTLKHILCRISSSATDFICKLMQQRFSEREMSNLSLAPLTIKQIAQHEWLQPDKRALCDTKVHFKELLLITSDGLAPV